MTGPVLLSELATHGIQVRAVGLRLAVRPLSSVTDEVRELIEQHRTELLMALDPDLAWRVDTMRRQIPAAPGPIPCLVARFEFTTSAGSCISCGEPLSHEPTIGSGRCDRCRIAASLVMLEQAGPTV